MKSIFVAFITCLAAVTSWGVGVGDKAPSLKGITAWYNGEGADPTDGKHIYVVEFWATWCPPCRTFIPHLNELHKKFKDKGVVIASISNEEKRAVEPFMKKVEMNYLVGVDPKNTTGDTNMDTVEGIPHAFIVNKEGVIVWDGHPMDGLDTVLADVVAGRWDSSKAADMAKDRKKQEELQFRLMQALQEDEPDTALKLLDELAEVGDNSMEILMMKASLLAENGRGEEAKAAYRQMLADAGNSAESLNMLAWGMLTMEPGQRDLGIALAAAEQASKLTEREDASVLDTLALAVYYLGDVDRATSIQEEALGKAGSDEKESLASTLAYYHSVQALRDEGKKAE